MSKKMKDKCYLVVSGVHVFQQDDGGYSLKDDRTVYSWKVIQDTKVDVAGKVRRVRSLKPAELPKSLGVGSIIKVRVRHMGVDFDEFVVVTDLKACWCGEKHHGKVKVGSLRKVLEFTEAQYGRSIQSMHHQAPSLGEGLHQVARLEAARLRGHQHHRKGATSKTKFTDRKKIAKVARSHKG